MAELGVERLNKRLVKIATNLAASPGGTLPQAFPEWAELKAAYRFFDRDKVSYERVVAPHLSMHCSPHPAAFHIAPAARLREFCF